MEALECGAACLAMVCAHYGLWLPLERVRRDCGVSRDGASALSVLRAARSYGLEARGYRLDPSELLERAVLPCVAHWGFDHFVVVCGASGSGVVVNDPARGRVRVSRGEFDRLFTGVALVMVPGEGFRPGGRRASVVAFARERLRGSRSAIALAASCSALAGFLALFEPALSQFLADWLLGGGRPGWVAPFMAAALLVFAARVTVGVVGAVVLPRLEGRLAIASSASFMWHVLRLPVEFFSQRIPADLAARQASNATVARRLVTIVAPLAIDLALLAANLALMVAYSPALAAIGAASALVNAGLAALVCSRRLNATRAMMRDEANLSAATMTGISQIETLKASGSEEGFFRRWAGLQAAANSQRVRLGEVDQRLGLLPQAVSALANVATLSCGVWLILRGSLTAGMLLAFQGFAQHLAAPVDRLTRSAQALLEMRADMERIKDVMDYGVDPLCEDVAAGPGSEDPSGGEGEDGAGRALEKLSGHVELSHVTFGYAPLGEPLVRDLSIDVPAGGSLALVGASGSGKSTVARLVSGICRPWEGRVLIDGRPLAEIPRDVRCASVAVIDQDVTIFGDTVSANIRLWDESIEDFEVVLAARDAGIHDEVVRREGGYGARLAEGGRDLSGGQRQRLEIARALAQDPTVLVMDEATSALDAQVEAEVMDAVRRRGATLIVIAHRLSAVRDCDRIAVIDHGAIVEQGTHDELMEAGGAYARLVSAE